MAVRQKQKVLDIAYEQFKKHGFPLDVEYKVYLETVGPKDALHAISVKRSFKAWKYLLHALKVKHPELVSAPAPAPKPAPKPEPAPEPKVDPLEALSQAAPAEPEESEE